MPTYLQIASDEEDYLKKNHYKIVSERYKIGVIAIQ